MKKVNKTLNIYISYSIRKVKTEAELCSFASEINYSLKRLGIDSKITFHKKGTTYTSDNLENADVVIFYGGAEKATVDRAIVDLGQYKEALHCYTTMLPAYFIEPDKKKMLFYKMQDIELLNVSEYRNTGELVYENGNSYNISELVLDLCAEGKINIYQVKRKETKLDLKLLLLTNKK